MASAERLLIVPELPNVAVESTRLSSPGMNTFAAAEAANDATYRTTLLRGGLVADLLGAAGRVLGPLTLIFTPGNTGPDRTGELNEPLRDISSPQPGPTDVATVDSGGVPTPEELPNVDVIAFPNPRGTPSSVPSPDIFPAPLGLPWDLPYGVPATVPLPSAPPRTAPRPSLRPAPDTVARPDVGPNVDPLADPFALPAPNLQPLPRPAARPAPEPAPRPSPRAPADPLALPFDPLRPFAQPESRPVPGDVTSDLIDFLLRGSPEPSPDAQPEPELDKCNCDSKKKKKKKKDKPKDRAVCWKGTYVQRARGISYTRREQVPCAPSISVPKSRQRTPKNVGDLVGDVFSFPLT